MNTPDRDTKTKLLEAAARIFAEKGYEEATLREICDAAGANSAAINYHFGEKRRLYVEAIRQVAGTCSVVDSLSSWTPHTTPSEKLLDFIRTLLGRMLDPHNADLRHRLMMRVMAQPTEGTADFVREFIRPDFELLLNILEELAPSRLTSARKQLLAFSVVGQCAHFRVACGLVALLTPPEEFASYTVENLAHHICNFTLSALGTQSLSDYQNPNT